MPESAPILATLITVLIGLFIILLIAGLALAVLLRGDKTLKP
jgi:hypothetical protein